VGDRDVRRRDAEGVGAGAGASRQDEPRPSRGLVRDGDLLERGALHPRPEGLHRRLLRGEEAGDVLADPSRLEGPLQLARGADPVEELLAVATEGLFDPVDLADVDSQAQGLGTVRIGGREERGAEGRAGRHSGFSFQARSSRLARTR
jgi:hypothetical protein